MSRGGVPVTLDTSEKIYVSGPQTMPSVTKNLGEIHGFMAIFLPDAFHALTGLDVAGLVDTSTDCRFIRHSWQHMANDVLIADDDTTRIKILGNFFTRALGGMPRSTSTASSSLPRLGDELGYTASVNEYRQEHATTRASCKASDQDNHYSGCVVLHGKKQRFSRCATP